MLKGVSLTAVSNDGLGEVTLPLSNQTAIVSAQLYPGDWSLKLNYTDEFNGVRWILDEYALGDLSENETIDADIELSRYVEISGNVYWDFNEDGEYQTGEELDESEVKLDSEEFESLNMTTGSDGKWAFYVPANNNYTINVSRLGFTYNNTLIVEVENTSINKEDLDVSLDADTVFVSGKIDIQYGFESLSDDIITDMSVELITAADEGYERENVDISISVNEDGDIVWNATVAPGKWVFHAEAPNFHMVVYAAFEAEIIDGGEHNTTIKAGGYLPISTRWTDFSGDERDVLTLESTNSTITGLVPLTLTLNEAKWNITVSETAEINECAVDDVKDNQMILDIGKQTIELIKNEISNCETVFWNGPVGVFETKPFHKGTFEIAKFIAEITDKNSLRSFAGGGDTISALDMAAVKDKFSYVSTGGGALLELIEGKKLPGLVALGAL